MTSVHKLDLLMKTNPAQPGSRLSAAEKGHSEDVSLIFLCLRHKGRCLILIMKMDYMEMTDPYQRKGH